jgi:hypothetical protein
LFFTSCFCVPCRKPKKLSHIKHAAQHQQPDT